MDGACVEEAAGAQVDGHDVPRAQPAAREDGLLGHVEDARLGSDQREAVRGHDAARRPQAVAVQGRAHHAPVREDDHGRTVPGLHHAGLVVEQVAHRGRQLAVGLPRGRDEQAQRVQEVAASVDEGGEGLVQAGGVAARRAHEGRGLARLHPDAVPLDGVDLAVVGEQPEGLGEGPGGIGVGAEALVEQGEGGRVGGMAQVRIEVGQVHGPHQGLVDEGAVAQGGDGEGVEPALEGARGGVATGGVEPALELVVGVSGRTRHHELDDRGPRALSLAAQHVLAVGDGAPAAAAQPRRGEGGRGQPPRPLRPLLLARKEDEAHREVAGGGRAEAEGGEVRFQDRVRDLGGHARAVSRPAVRVHRPPMAHAAQRGQGQGQHAGAGGSVQLGQEAHAAGVVLEGVHAASMESGLPCVK